jgi:DNA mismatch endonuclease (patch repair protein)
VDFWSAKFVENVNRDRLAMDALHMQGWTIIVIWECETTRVDTLVELTNRIKAIEPIPRGKRYSTTTKTFRKAIAA